MTTLAGHGIATIAEYPDAPARHKDGPADPARLAEQKAPHSLEFRAAAPKFKEEAGG